MGRVFVGRIAVGAEERRGGGEERGGSEEGGTGEEGSGDGSGDGGWDEKFPLAPVQVGWEMECLEGGKEKGKED